MKGAVRLEKAGEKLTELEKLFHRLSDADDKLTKSVHELREITSQALYMMLKERDNE